MDLSTVSTSDLQAEIQRRERSVAALERKRARLAEELEGVQAELDLLGAAPAPGASPAASGGRKRARNAISLGDALAQAMEVRAVVTPTEAAELVRANGYQSTSKNFAMMVSNALAKDARFKRIARGQYERIA